MSKQGLTVIGTLANIKQIEAKEYDGKTIPTSQKLQLTIMNDDGLSLIDIKDSNFKITKDSLGKELSLAVAYTAMGGNVYFRLI